MRNLTDTHIWSFMADNEDHHCLYNKFNNRPTVDFIGSHYFCEAGTTTHWQRGVVYIGDPLWDGRHCNDSEQECCILANRVTTINTPNFYRSGLIPGDYDIILCACADQGTDDEDVGFYYYEIYVC